MLLACFLVFDFVDSRRLAPTYDKPVGKLGGWPRGHFAGHGETILSGLGTIFGHLKNWLWVFLLSVVDDDGGDHRWAAFPWSRGHIEL